MTNIVDERGYNQIFAASPAQQLRLRRRAQAIVGAMAIPASGAGRDRRLLELGCGMGELAYLLATLTDAQITGVDLSARFVAHACATYRHPNLAFLKADLTRELPDAGQERYDYIVGNGILHHLYHHLDAVLANLRLWLRPGGRLIFWEPNLWNPYIFSIFTISWLRRAARLEPDEMAFTPEFIRRRLHATGFSGISARPRDFLLPNTPTPLIRPVVAIGDWLEKFPLLDRLAQSVFIVAERPPD